LKRTVEPQLGLINVTLRSPANECVRFILKVIADAAVIVPAGNEMLLVMVGVPDEEIPCTVLLIPESVVLNVPPVLVAVSTDAVPEHTVAGERDNDGAGKGLTVTVILDVTAGQVAGLMGVGVMTYCTVPAAEVLGLISTWLISFPAPAIAPVIPPVTVPTVHV